MSPSKIHAYLGYGKPLLYIGPPRTNVAEAIEEYQCGFRCPQGDLESLTYCLKFLASEGFDLEPFRRRALDAVQQRYCESVGVEEVRRYIMEVEYARPTIPFPSESTRWRSCPSGVWFKARLRSILRWWSPISSRPSIRKAGTTIMRSRFSRTTWQSW